MSDRIFTIDDPRTLERILDVLPGTAVVPEIEYGYDVTPPKGALRDQSTMVACIHCGHPNHWIGLVMKYPDGSRILVGHDCGFNHYGIEFTRQHQLFTEQRNAALRVKRIRAIDAKERRDHRPLPGSPVTDADDPVFQNSRLQPFLDQADDAPVADPVLHEAKQPFLAYLVEEAANIGVQYPAHLLADDPGRQRVQRIVLASVRTESIREPGEVFLVDRVQHREGRSLGDLVFESGHRERALAAVRLRYVPPPRRLRPIRSPMDPAVQIGELALEIGLVVLPCDPVTPGAASRLRA